MRRRLAVDGRAREEIREALGWWRENRSKAPRALAEELKESIQVIREFPFCGRRVVGRPGVLSYPLKKVRYALFYRFRDDLVEVVSLWHSSRGEEPDV